MIYEANRGPRRATGTSTHPSNPYRPHAFRPQNAAPSI
jgi:hypothetical protein